MSQQLQFAFIDELDQELAEWRESQRRSERTKVGLAMVRKQGKVLGRPQGSHDKGKRKRTGYLLRYAG